MKKIASTTGIILLLVALIAGLAAFGQSSRHDSKGHEEASAPSQWEYLVVSGGNVNLSTAGNESYGGMRKQPDGAFNREAFPLERNLDKLGAKGWELVAVTGPPNDPIFYLKRPKESH
ncbi:MAG TPA: hypothetical protein VFD58_07080 [Blastocatellia bacterium]|nr:hypothetical protein [Blastocatellia bacterium]